MKLFKLYAAFVRPIIEINSVVYHSMLGKGQAAEIERLQKLVVRLCFSPGRNYTATLEENHFKSLSERKEKAVSKFVKGAMENQRFASRRFEPRDPLETDLRRRKPYKETRARTERYYRSPMLHFQRVANRLYVN